MNISWIFNNLDTIAGLTLTHLVYTLVPTVLGLVLSIPLGALAHRVRPLRNVIVNVSSVLYTIPSLALFVLLPRILGTQILDPLNVVVALTIYSIALMVREVVAGLDSVPDEVTQEAIAMGVGGIQRFFQIELPCALPVLFGALRVATVSNISIVTVAALVGIEQLGSLFTIGFSRRMYTPIIAGLVVCLILSLVLDRLILIAGRKATPWDQRS